jgi:hypothetical protein
MSPHLTLLSAGSNGPLFAGVTSRYTMQGKLFRSYLLAITIFAVTTVYYILKYFIIGKLYLAKSKIYYLEIKIGSSQWQLCNKSNVLLGCFVFGLLTKDKDNECYKIFIFSLNKQSTTQRWGRTTQST